MTLATASAGADPAKLPELTAADVAEDSTRVFARGVTVDHLLRQFALRSFVMASSGRKLVGRIGVPGDPPARGATRAAAFAAVLGTDPVVVPGKGRAPTVDLRFSAAPVATLLRLTADVANVDYVIATRRTLPAVTLDVRRTGADAVAKAIAQIAGLEMSQRGTTWIFVDPQLALERKLLDKRRGGVEIELRGARPDEARALLDPAAPPRSCAGVVHARVRGGATGPLEAVLAALPGAACAPTSAAVDPATDLVVGVVRGKASRAIARKPDGSVRVVEPGAVTLTSEAPLRAAEIGQHDPTGPCGDAAGPAWTLVATVALESRWLAIFERPSGEMAVVHLTGSVFGIDAGSVTCWDRKRAYRL